MYCIPHILHIPKTLIPTPSPTRAPASSRSIAIERPPHTQTHPESCPLSPSPPPPRSARRSASPRAVRPAPRSPAAPSSRDTPSPWKPRRARKRSSARTTRTSSTRPRYDARLARDSTRDARKRRAERDIFFLCVSIHRAVHRCGGPSRRRARTRSNPSRGRLAIAIDIQPSSRGRSGGRAFGGRARARASTDDFHACVSLPSSRRRPASTFRTRAARAPAPRARARSR